MNRFFLTLTLVLTISGCAGVMKQKDPYMQAPLPCRLWNEGTGCSSNIFLKEAMTPDEIINTKPILLELEKWADYLKANKKADIYVEGHVYSIQDPKRETTRSETIANVVKNYLESRGVDASQMKVVALGAEKPLAMPETNKSNLRVTLTFETESRGAKSPKK